MTITPPDDLPNLIDGADAAAASGATLVKVAPHDGTRLWSLARSAEEDAEAAVTAAVDAQRGWARLAPPERGDVLFRLAELMAEHAEDFTRIIALETGRSPSEARGEVSGAIAQARYFAGEGRRLHGRTLTSAVATKRVMTVREPVGVALLIIASNAPVANIAWKTFPALICGNACVLKAPEDTPATAWLFGELTRRAGLPAGVFNIVHGLGDEAGQPLVDDHRVDVISFTGSTAVGRQIARTAADRLARVSLELGGKNPFVVCDDADLDRAVRWAALSAFSNAGQRCSSGSRTIVMDGVYDEFVDALVGHARDLRLGPTDDDDLGPVISEAALERITTRLAAVDGHTARILVGGGRLDTPAHRAGSYLAPTVVEILEPSHELSGIELFGPVAQLYRAADYRQALELANDSPYGLTAAIHTRSVDRALHFTSEVSAGVAVVNAGTFGSEPHMPFGGRRASGNGTREPGVEALDVYSELKAIHLWLDETDL
jgi:alpha-ketoglutaric semialdehyde dehydrogenase